MSKDEITLTCSITEQVNDIIESVGTEIGMDINELVCTCIIGYAMPKSRNIVYCPKCEKALWFKELMPIYEGIQDITCDHCNHVASYDYGSDKWVVIRKEAAKEVIRDLFILADKKGLSGYAIAKGCGIAESNVNRIKAGLYMPKLDSYLALKDYIENY